MDESSIYTGFADVYDTLMEDVPYAEWCGRITELLGRYDITEGLVLDLGCGTGTMTELLAAAGYDMIGVDASEEMLMRAQEKREASGYDILYLCQDMRELELYGTVRAAVCVCDALNYITDTEELIGVLRLVDNYLDPGGLFYFDFNTVHKYRDVIGDTTIAEARESVSFIWENSWHEEERINEYELTLFLREGRLYRRERETHYQRGYDAAEIREALDAAGMECLLLYDAATLGEVTEQTERAVCVAREQRKRR